MVLVEFIALVFTLYVTAYVVYSLMLVAVSFFIHEDEGLEVQKATFAIIIPAHNEELLLPRLLKSIHDQSYPDQLVETIVVADNCTDDTERVALENGARVLRRVDAIERGKGYAIRMALLNIDLTRYDAIFIVDADSVIDKAALGHIATAVSKGHSIIQCFNGVLNSDENWFTRLMDVSRTISNEIYHPAKHKLGLSSHLMGNGMCFTNDVLLKYGWDAFTIGEDWEFYARLIENGEKVAFSNKARVYHQESSSLKQATSQRGRWSSGRFAVAWKYGMRLMLKGILERDIVKVDASLPLIFPNPSLGVNITVGLFAWSLLAPGAYTIVSPTFLLGLLLLQSAIFLLGISYTDNKKMKLASVFLAPLFLGWKLGIDILSFFGMWRTKWVRTARKV